MGILTVVILLTGCSGKRMNATDILARVLSQSNTPVMSIYFDGAVPDEEGYLAEEESKLLYGGQSPGDLSVRYAIALGKDDRIYEIHLYWALDHAKADQISRLLENRRTLLCKQENYLYDPDSIAAGAMIWRKGKWVALLVTDENSQIAELLDKLTE